MRENTERPITVEQGTNRLVGNDSDRAREAFHEGIDGEWGRSAGIPPWAGKAIERIAGELSSRVTRS